MLNIALPKGRLGDQVYKMLSSIGYECAAIYEDNRKLVFESPENGVRYLLVKPSDVAIYVEHGAADVGIGREGELHLILPVAEFHGLRGFAEPGQSRYGCQQTKSNAPHSNTRVSPSSPLPSPQPWAGA